MIQVIYSTVQKTSSFGHHRIII